MSKKFYGLYCGYSQEDILKMIQEIQNKGITLMMDNYIIRVIDDSHIMEDKWEAEPPKILHGGVEKVVLDAVSIEYLNKRSRFHSVSSLIDYMISEEEADMEEYLQHEEEWEY